MVQGNTPDASDFDSKLAELTPEQAQMFVKALELAMRKRRMLLLGYLVTITIVVVGFFVSLLVYGSMPRGTFVGWVFLLPGVGAALALLIFGKIVKRMGRNG